MHLWAQDAVVSPALEGFVVAAERLHGIRGKQAAEFLVQGMPARDRTTLSTEFLMENLTLALHARDTAPWREQISDDLFLNHVLPYVCLDEPRERWRPAMTERAAHIVAGVTNISDAVQALNRELFAQIGVHYSRERKRANQAPQESIDLGKASCTGLSILLVDACRAVGIPARVAGIPLWTDKSGNHNWVEIWDGEWKWTGADEYDPKGLSRTWFNGKAAKANEADWRTTIYATQWAPCPTHFPMVWDLSLKDVYAENVTARYKQEPTAGGQMIKLRILDVVGGKRIPVVVQSADGQSHTCRVDRTDFNDVLELQPQTKDFVFEYKGEHYEQGLKPSGQIIELHWNECVASVGKMTPESLWKGCMADRMPTAKQALADKSITLDGKTLRFLAKTFGDEAPTGGYPLFISLHGGGGAPPAVNDRQWQNQIRLYQAEAAIFVAPRAPTDTWNLWHQAHIDPLFDKLIEAYVIAGGVDPNRVYLIGYSAGGDGVYQLAPRMADRFAAASMMAGHPNETKPDGLRNLPFAIFCGGNDAAYKRNQVAADWAKQLAVLQLADPQGYVHRCTIYPGLGHWMNGKDREAIPWLLTHTRNPWPKKIVWLQDDVTHDRFYWLARPADAAQKGDRIEAEVVGQEIRIKAEGIGPLAIRLSPKLLNLDDEIRVIRDGKPAFRGHVKNDPALYKHMLDQRADPLSAANAEIRLP